MAAAMTMQPPNFRYPSVPSSSSPNPNLRFNEGPGSAAFQNYISIGLAGKDGPGTQCDGCRRRNSRCAMNLATNKCYSCDFHRQDCVFTPNTSRKRSHPSPFDLAGKKSFHAAYNSLSSSYSDLSQSPMTGGSSSGSSNIASIAPRAAERTAYHRYVRGTCHLDPLLLEHAPLDGNDEVLLNSIKFRKIGSGPSEFVEVWDPHTDDAREILSARLLETLSPADVDILVQGFFEVVHPVFPILDQHAFLLSWSSRTVEPLLLVTVCVVARAWLSTIHRPSREINMSGLEVMLWEHLKTALDRPSITTLQAGLLLLQYPNHSYQQFSSQLILAAFDLGLHHDCLDWTSDPKEKRSRRRLAWALYAQDKWASLLHGRPAHMTEAHWTVQDLGEDDFESIPDTDEKQQAVLRHCASVFMQLIIVSQLLAEILQTFYTLSAEHEVRTSSGNGLRKVLERAKPIQIKLRDWFSRLPASLKMDASDEEPNFGNGILHLAYFATEIALHRCIIHASVTAGTDPYVAHICRSAGKTRLISAMDFVNRLRPSNFQSCWPLASASNFGSIGSFGVLLGATAATREEADFYRARLQEFRWTLAVTRRSADFLDASIHQFETSTELLGRMAERPEMAEFLVLNPPPQLMRMEAGGRRRQEGGEEEEEEEEEEELSSSRQHHSANHSAFDDVQERASAAFTGFSSPSGTSTSSERDGEMVDK